MFEVMIQRNPSEHLKDRKTAPILGSQFLAYTNCHSFQQREAVSHEYDSPGHNVRPAWGEERAPESVNPTVPQLVMAFVKYRDLIKPSLVILPREHQLFVG
ncbi:hypothetical protein TWF506_006219 [Arthrobotrys conoides]|uniref:Uncharacterized protein n=1 Tax=Arthrobotrys conoides TaxID=74498 RepID=A0AAN8N8P0_9PEZI